jgi:hypothetical protein
MTLIDPREALAEQSTFVGYLMGLVSLGRVVRALADGADGGTDTGDADDFVHMLVGLASIGKSIERLAETEVSQDYSVTSPPPDSAITRWLR